jgi:hypothetical protein
MTCTRDCVSSCALVEGNRSTTIEPSAIRTMSITRRKTVTRRGNSIGPSRKQQTRHSRVCQSYPISSRPGGLCRSTLGWIENQKQHKGDGNKPCSPQGSHQ